MGINTNTNTASVPMPSCGSLAGSTARACHNPTSHHHLIRAQHKFLVPTLGTRLPHRTPQTSFIPPRQHVPAVKFFHITRTMSSDADYAAFLEKANQDTGASNVTSQSTKSRGSKVVDTEVPANLQSIDVIYESEADEPFEPVSLKWNKEELPTQEELSELIGNEARKVTWKEFDLHHKYKHVGEAVKEAGSRDVAFFEVDLGRSRVERYIISVDKEHKRIVGMKAIAIES